MKAGSARHSAIMISDAIGVRVITFDSPDEK